MEYIVIVVVIIALALLKIWYDKRKAEIKLARRIKEAWGRVPQNQYEPSDLKTLSRLFYLHDSKATVHVVDDTTWNDLEMDLLFSQINSTWTSMGDQALYSLLRTPVYSQEQWTERKALIEYWENHPEMREKIQSVLARTGKFFPDRLNVWMEPNDYLEFKDKWLYKVLTFLPFVSVPLFFLSVGGGLIFAIVNLACNALYHELSIKKLHAGLEAVTQAVSVVALAKGLIRIPVEALKERFQSIRESLKGLDALAQKGHINNLYISFIGDMATDMASILKMLFLFDIWSYQASINIIKKHQAELIKLIKEIGELDATLAIASYRQSLSVWCIPQIQWEAPKHPYFIEAEKVVHPLIQRCTPNPIRAAKATLLTGSNASGKSTYLKTVAINTLTAHTLCLCYAEQWISHPLFPMTSMALRDSILNGESYYVAEIKSLRRIFALASGSVRCLCIIDEVLRGTNTIERIAASSRILSALARLNTCIFAATHDVELTSILRDVFENKHFEEHITDKDITFDYTLKEGKATTRNAIKLLKLMGFEDDIINSAEEAVACFEKNNQWPVLKKEEYNNAKADIMEC